MALFRGNLVFAFFLYGLAFFVLSLTVGIKIRGIGAFRLARVSRSLSGYGVLQGAEGWMDMFILTGEIGSSAFLLYTIVEVASFIFLLQFSIGILTSHRKRWWARLAPIVLFLFWALGVIFLKPLFLTDVGWFIAVDAWSRYTLGLLAGIIAFYALISERHALAEGSQGIENNLLYAGSSIGLLSVFTIIGPEATFFPASLINYTSFSKMVGIPVQIFIVICVMSLTYFITESLYSLETNTNIQLHHRMRDYTKQLEHSNRLKDLFTDILRHDLLNPMSVIQNASELITPDDSTEEIQMNLGIIRRNTNAVIEIIETASNYAKIEILNELDLEEVNLSEIIAIVVENTQGLAEEKCIKIENNVKGEFKVSATPFILHVFSNLLSNAIKYSPKDSKVIIKIKEEDKDWRVMIKDNGEGVPDKYKESIFQRFERVEKGGVKGTGLGLAIAKRMMELHNGKIWVEDNPEGGSIFQVSIPKKKRKVLQIS